MTKDRAAGYAGALGARLGAQGARRACMGRAGGSWALGELQERGARGARLAGRQARGLALGCALGALDLFSICFDSVFS